MQGTRERKAKRERGSEIKTSDERRENLSRACERRARLRERDERHRQREASGEERFVRVMSRPSRGRADDKLQPRLENRMDLKLIPNYGPFTEVRPVLGFFRTRSRAQQAGPNPLSSLLILKLFDPQLKPNF